MNFFQYIFLASFVLLGMIIADASKPKKSCPTVIRRGKWLAGRAEFVVKPTVKPDLVVIHNAKVSENCTDTYSCAAIMRFLQYKDMMDDQKQDIGYNFCLGTDGKIYEGRGWGRVAQHAKKYNNRSIGFCIIGASEDFSPALELVIQQFLECSMKRNFLSKNYTIVAHNQIRNVECPGETISRKISMWKKFNLYIVNLNDNSDEMDEYDETEE